MCSSTRAAVRAPASTHVTVHDGFTLADVTMLRAQAQRSQRRRQSRRLRRQPEQQLGRRGAIGRSEYPSTCADARGAICWRRCCSSQAFRCCWRATRSATARTATTTPTVRITRSAGSIGPASASTARTTSTFVVTPDSDAPPLSAASAATLAQRQDGNHPPDILWLTPHGGEMSPEDWAFPEARFLSLRAGRDRRRRRAAFHRHECRWRSCRICVSRNSWNWRIGRRF